MTTAQSSDGFSPSPELRLPPIAELAVLAGILVWACLRVLSLDKPVEPPAPDKGWSYSNVYAGNVDRHQDGSADVHFKWRGGQPGSVHVPAEIAPAVSPHDPITITVEIGDPNNYHFARVGPKPETGTGRDRMKTLLGLVGIFGIGKVAVVRRLLSTMASEPAPNQDSTAIPKLRKAFRPSFADKTFICIGSLAAFALIAAGFWVERGGRPLENGLTAYAEITDRVAAEDSLSHSNEIGYKYTVGQRLYWNRESVSGATYSSLLAATSTPVKYDPANPIRSTVEPHHSAGVGIALQAFAVFIGIKFALYPLARSRWLAYSLASP